MKKRLCWFCKKKTKDWRVTILWNAQGRYDARYDFICIPCLKQQIMVALAKEVNVSLLVGKN